MRLGLEIELRGLQKAANFHIVGVRQPVRHRGVRHIGDGEHLGADRLVQLGHTVIQRLDAVTLLLHFREQGGSVLALLLEDGDLLRDGVLLGLERFGLCNRAAALCIHLEQVVKAEFLPAPRNKAGNLFRVFANTANI